MPITVLALAGSLAGILVGDIYAAETANWAGQAVGQDIASSSRADRSRASER